MRVQFGEPVARAGDLWLEVGDSAEKREDEEGSSSATVKSEESVCAWEI